MGRLGSMTERSFHFLSSASIVVLRFGQVGNLMVVESVIIIYSDHRLCLPLVSIGRHIIAMKEASMSAPEIYIGIFGFAVEAWIATIGAQSPATRLKKEAIPVPVPRLGAGNVSVMKASLVKSGQDQRDHGTYQECRHITHHT